MSAEFVRDASGIAPGARPRLRPEAVLLSRGDTECQVGVDGGNSLRIPDLDGHLQTVLRALDGHRSWSAILAHAAAWEVDAAALERVLRTLAAAGLADLGHLGSADPSPRGEVRLVGLGALGAAIGEQLVRSGIRRLHVVDGSPADPMETRAESFRRDCERRGIGTWAAGDPVRVSNHWTKPETAEVALTVLAPDALEADRRVAADLLRRDAPHLVVRPAAAGAVVGPLVVPGRSSCLHCCDLTRRDADPAWPHLLSQLTRRIAAVPPAVAAWATSATVTQVLSFLSGSRPETVGATLEMAAPSYTMRLRSWPAHAECGCSWNAG